MRKLILFILSGAMLIGGLYTAILELFFSHIIYFWHDWFAFGGGVLAFAAAYPMRTDFIAPRLDIKTWGD